MQKIIDLRKLVPLLIFFCCLTLLCLILPTSSVKAAITYGSENSFNLTTSDISIASLDSTHYVVAYKDLANGGVGTAKVCVISGTTITSCGDDVWFTSGENYVNSVTALDSTHFAVLYNVTGVGSYVVIGNTNGGTTINGYGTAVSVDGTPSSYNSISTLSSTKFVIAYQGDSKAANDRGTAVIGTVPAPGSDSITLGTPVEFNLAVTNYISTSALDSTHFVVTYSDNGNSDYGTGIIGEVSGISTITFGSENVFSSASTIATSVTTLDSTHFALVYTTDTASNVQIGNTNGATTINGYGTAVSFDGMPSSYNSISTLSSTKFVIAYQGDSKAANDRGTAVIGTVPAPGSDSITLGTPVEFNLAVTNYLDITSMDDEYFAIAYQDAGNSNAGTAIIGYEQQEEQGIIPELPSNNLWKVLIAILALGLVIGIVTWKKKNGTLNSAKK